MESVDYWPLAIILLTTYLRVCPR